MSFEHDQFDTQPAIDVVSDDIILPVAESSVFSRTRDKYKKMNRKEKIDFGLAVAATLGGVALTTGAYFVEKRNPSSKVPTAMRAVAYSLDYADGYFAKRSATESSDGATTELGAIADPLADKYNNTLNEIALVQSGRLSMSDLAIRAARDVSITAARRHVTKKTEGRVDVKANKFGKMNTVVRDGVNLFASTQVAEDHPRVSRTLHTAANTYSVVSAIYTATQLGSAYRKEIVSQSKD